jgi:hypothetical protein
VYGNDIISRSMSEQDNSPAYGFISGRLWGTNNLPSGTNVVELGFGDTTKTATLSSSSAWSYQLTAADITALGGQGLKTISMKLAQNNNTLTNQKVSMTVSSVSSRRSNTIRTVPVISR